MQVLGLLLRKVLQVTNFYGFLWYYTVKNMPVMFNIIFQSHSRGSRIVLRLRLRNNSRNERLIFLMKVAHTKIIVFAFNWYCLSWLLIVLTLIHTGVVSIALLNFEEILLKKLK
jgi:hypothetical protein